MGAKTIGSVDVMKLPSYSNYSTLKFYVKYFFMEIGVLAHLLPLNLCGSYARIEYRIRSTQNNYPSDILILAQAVTLYKFL